MNIRGFGRISGLTLVAAVALVVGRAPAFAGQAGDPVKGKAVFARCAACHTMEPGRNRLGPSLAGVVGRRAGGLAGFNYSPALRSSNIVWNGAALDNYIRSPRAFIPGNRMMYAGLTKSDDRANLVAYLAHPVK